MSSMTGTQIDWVETLTGQTLLFSVLAKLIYEYPEKKWLESLIAEDVFAEVPFAINQSAVVAGLQVLQAWSQAKHDGIPDDIFDTLRADYTALFLGPGKVTAAPWESVYFNEERLVFQEQTLQVRDWFARFGLALVNLHKEPDDHIGLELEFLAHLAKQGLQALEAENTSQFDELLGAQRQFMTEHPLKWMFQWCDLVEKNAKTDFYRGVALVTRGSLLELANVLGAPLPKAK